MNNLSPMHFLWCLLYVGTIAGTRDAKMNEKQTLCPQEVQSFQ